MRVVLLALVAVVVAGVPRVEARVAWCDQHGAPGQWQEIDRFLVARGFAVGPPCLEQTTGGTHSAASIHYPRNGARARDFAASGVDHVGIARFLEPYARGPGYVVEELFCEDVGIRWSHGVRSSFHDEVGHTHVGLRDGAVFPRQPSRRRDDDR